MGRAAVGARFGAAAVIALLTVACATSPAPAGPTPSVGFGAPSAPLSTPGAMLSTSPTAQVLGARATSTAESFGTPTPANYQTVTADMQQLSQQLQGWAAGNPTPNDLLDMVDRANMLMADLKQAMPQMSAEDREQALAGMSTLMGQMIQVMDAHVRQPAGGTMGTPGSVSRPYGGMVGTNPTATPAGMLSQATPVTGTMSTQQMMTQIDQMRDQLMQIWSDQPSDADITDMMSRMQGLLLAMSRQTSSLTSQDLQALTADMAQATDDLVRVMETYVQQETSANP